MALSSSSNSQLALISQQRQALPAEADAPRKPCCAALFCTGLTPSSCSILCYQWTSLTDGKTESERGPEAETPRSAAAENGQHSVCWPGPLRHHQSAAFPPRSLMIDFLPRGETEPAERSLDVQASASICQRRGTPFSDLTPPPLSVHEEASGGSGSHLQPIRVLAWGTHNMFEALLERNSNCAPFT